MENIVRDLRHLHAPLYRFKNALESLREGEPEHRISDAHGALRT